MCCVPPRDCTEPPSAENISCPKSAGVKPLLQGCIFYWLLWKHQDTGNTRSKHAQGKRGHCKQSPLTWLEGDDRLDPQLLSQVHVAAKLYPRTPSEAASCFWGACWMPRASLGKGMCPEAQCHQPHSLPISGGKQRQCFNRRLSQGTLKTHAKRSLNFPKLAQVRILLCRVRQSVPHPSPGRTCVLFFSHFFFFFFLI